MTSYIQSGINYICNSWEQKQHWETIGQLETALQDHKKSPNEIYNEIQQQTRFDLSTDMMYQAIELDKIVKNRAKGGWQKDLKISNSNIQEIVSQTPILNNIAGQPTWFDGFCKFYDGADTGSGGIASTQTRHPKLQERLAGAMQDTVSKKTKDVVKSLINFKLTAKDPFTNNSHGNPLTLFPHELQLKLLSDVANSPGSPPQATQALFERMNMGLTHGDLERTDLL